MAKITSEQVAERESAEVGRQDVSALVERVIQDQPPAMRMYPDLYAHLVTRALLDAGLLVDPLDSKNP